MPKLLVFVACEKVLISEEDMSPSVISIFHQLTVGEKPEDLNAQAALSWCLFSLWRRLPEDSGKRFEQRTLLIAPDSTERAEVILPFDLAAPAHRNVVKVFGFPIGQAGEYTARLSIREYGTSEPWANVADYTITIVHVVPQTDKLPD